MPTYSLTSRAATIVLAAFWAVTASTAGFVQGAKAEPTAPPVQAVPAVPQAAPSAPKEVTLTGPQIQHMLEAQPDFDVLAEEAMKAKVVEPDAKTIAQFESIAKKYGFASYADYSDVVFTVSGVMNGYDPKARAYVGPEAVLKQELAAIEADPKIAAEEKKAMIDEINMALRSPPPPIADKANVDIVSKYYDRIAALLQR